LNQPKRNGISRRQFARRAALLSASAAIVPTAGVLAETLPAGPVQETAPHPNLSTASQTEADARLQQILAQYGSRFSDDETALLHKINLVTQQALDRVHAFPLENSDSPALYLKPLVEREKKQTETPAVASGKKS
jgi:hypothetical protein